MMYMMQPSLRNKNKKTWYEHTKKYEIQYIHDTCWYVPCQKDTLVPGHTQLWFGPFHWRHRGNPDPERCFFVLQNLFGNNIHYLVLCNYLTCALYFAHSNFNIRQPWKRNSKLAGIWGPYTMSLILRCCLGQEVRHVQPWECRMYDILIVFLPWQFITDIIIYMNSRIWFFDIDKYDD